MIELEQRVQRLEEATLADSAALPATYTINPNGEIGAIQYLPGVLCGTGQDNGPLLQEAAESLQPRGGTIYLPPCDIYYSTPLEFDQFRSVTFQGQGGVTAGAAGPTRLIYYGPNLGEEEAAISCRSTVGMRFLDMQMLYTTNLEGMHLLDFSHSINSDASFMELSRVLIGGNTENSTAYSLVNLDQSIFGTFRQTYTLPAQTAFRGITASNTYSNNHVFDACRFTSTVLAPIMDPGEAWTFLGPGVEPLRSGAAGFIGQNEGIHPIHTLTIIGGWCGDATHEGDWIVFSGQGLTILGLQAGNGATLARLGLNGPVEGLTIRGGHFDSITNLLAVEGEGHTAWDIQDNGYIATGPIAFAPGSTMPDRSVIDNPKDNIYSTGMTMLHGGAITNGSFPAPPPNGTLAYDEIGHRLYIKSGGTWRHSAAAFEP